MIVPQSDNHLIKLLLDDGVEIKDIDLSQTPRESLILAVKVLRAHDLMLMSVVSALSDQLRMIDAFARPQTRRAFHAQDKDNIVQ